MGTRLWNALMSAVLAVPLATGFPTDAAAKPKQDYVKAAKEAEKAAKQEAKAAQKAGKPVRIKAPPKPGVQTALKPGTWRHHRHKGNSPFFKHDRPDKPGKGIKTKKKHGKGGHD